MKNTSPTMVQDTITAENYHVFANRLVISQLKKFLANMQQPTEEMTADEVNFATSSASYERIRIMLNDAIALMRIDERYTELCERLAAYSTAEYYVKKAVVKLLKARKARAKKPSKKPRKKPFTLEDEKTLTAFEIYVTEYEYLQNSIDRNRIERDNNSGHNNTACDLLQTAYEVTCKYIGHAPHDIVEIKAYKNGNVKEQTLLQVVRNAIQNTIRREERTNVKAQSYEELTRYHDIIDNDTGEVIGYEEIEPLYIDGMYAIDDYETYSETVQRIDNLKMSQQQERIVKLRLRGYSLQQIADIETERKIKDECINALVFYGQINKTEAKKRYAKLAETMTAYDIQDTMIKSGYIDEVEKATAVKTGDIAKQLKRVQEKYITAFGVPSSVDMAKAKK